MSDWLQNCCRAGCCCCCWRPSASAATARCCRTSWRPRGNRRQSCRKAAQQAGLIATLQTRDAQNRALMAQQRQERQLRQQHEAYQRKYREAIKTIPAPLSLCPALCLSSCAAAGAAGRAAVAPESVFAPCEQPQLQGETRGDAVSYTGVTNLVTHLRRPWRRSTPGAPRCRHADGGVSVRVPQTFFLLLKRSFGQGYGPLQSL